MSKLNGKLINLSCRFKSFKWGVSEKFKKRDLGGKEIIIEVALLIIAVLLIVLFRTEIVKVVTSAIKKISDGVNGMFAEPILPAK